MCEPCVRNAIQSGGAPIGVVRVRRVHIAARIAIPYVVRVVAVSRPTETVLRTYSLQPKHFSPVFLFGRDPSFYRVHSSIYNPIPENDFLRSEM